MENEGLRLKRVKWHDPLTDIPLWDVFNRCMNSLACYHITIIGRLDQPVTESGLTVAGFSGFQGVGRLLKTTHWGDIKANDMIPWLLQPCRVYVMDEWRVWSCCHSPTWADATNQWQRLVWLDCHWILRILGWAICTRTMSWGGSKATHMSPHLLHNCKVYKKDMATL